MQTSATADADNGWLGMGWDGIGRIREVGQGEEGKKKD